MLRYIDLLEKVELQERSVKREFPRGAIRDALHYLMDDCGLTIKEISQKADVPVSVLEDYLDHALSEMQLPPRLFDNDETKVFIRLFKIIFEMKRLKDKNQKRSLFMSIYKGPDDMIEIALRLLKLF